MTYCDHDENRSALLHHALVCGFETRGRARWVLASDSDTRQATRNGEEPDETSKVALEVVAGSVRARREDDTDHDAHR